MAAIETCRTAALGGHVDACDDCGLIRIAYDIRRFLLHILPKGFHRIRLYGLLASAGRKANLTKAGTCSPCPRRARPMGPTAPSDHRPPCFCCGGRMTIIETFERGRQARVAHGLALQPRRSYPCVFLRLLVRCIRGSAPVVRARTFKCL